MNKKIMIILAWVTFPAALLGLIAAIFSVWITTGHCPSFVEGFKFMFFGIEKNKLFLK